MSNIIIVTGSARPNSLSHKVAPIVEQVLKTHEGVDVDIVDVATLGLPFFDSPITPSGEGFAPTDERVLAWTQKVGQADGVIMLTPEYNGNVTAIQKNAIDWVYKEWNEKPVALIGYGWYEPSRSQAALRVSFETVLKAKLVEPFTQLQFMKDITTEGDIIDQAAIDAKLAATVDAFVSVLPTATSK